MWTIDSALTTAFDFDYQSGRDQLLRLYDKGTRKQWLADDRLDWSMEVDPTDPLGMPDQTIPIADSPIWERLSDDYRDQVRLHTAAWRFSQFLHGEQGALICTAKIVQSVPQIDAKFYAATQVIDEARHVEVYSRYLHEKLGLVYPLDKNLESLLDDVISDSRWDMTYLGMQVLIEGLALAAFGLIRNHATEPLGKALNAYVMQDEARHVMFGRLALRDLYPQLTAAERDEREEFCVDACYRMRDRFLAEDLWRTLDIPLDEVKAHLLTGESHQIFNTHLFLRIVPILRDIGLWARGCRRRSATWASSASPMPTSTPRWPTTSEPPPSTTRLASPTSPRWPGPPRGSRRSGASIDSADPATGLLCSLSSDLWAERGQNDGRPREDL